MIQKTSLLSLKQLFIFLVLMTLILALTGCGYHLRGYDSGGALPPVAKKVYIHVDPQAPTSPQTSASYGNLNAMSPDIYSFEIALVKEIKAFGSEVVNSPSQATAIINVTSQSLSSQQLSLSGALSASQNALYYSVTYNVEDANGHKLQEPITISTNTTYTSSAAQQLSVNNQMNRLASNLQQRVAHNLALQLQALKPSADTIVPNTEK